MERPALVEKWYKDNQKQVLKYLKRRSRSDQDAEDIFQDTAIELLTRSLRWELANKKTITRWALWDFYHKDPHYSAQYVPLDTLAKTPREVYIEDQLDAKVCLKIIQTLVEELPAKSNTKKIFIARFLEDRDYLQISQELGIPHGSCRQLGSRAADIIKEKFNSYIEQRR